MGYQSATVIETQVTLSAGQAAGTAALLAANPNRRALTIGNPGANNMTIVVTPSSGAGFGMPLPAGGVIAFGQELLAPNQAIYCLGTTGDKITIWEA